MNFSHETANRTETVTAAGLELSPWETTIAGQTDAVLVETEHGDFAIPTARDFSVYGSVVSSPAILYPTRGSVMMYLGSAASSPSLLRSLFTTSRTSPRTRRSSTLWFSVQGDAVARRMGTSEPG